jgi:hypothetical protein
MPSGISNDIFCFLTSLKSVLDFNVATGNTLLENMKATKLIMMEKMSSGRITFHVDIPDAFMATSS